MNQKKFRITKYREMEMYPEISDALDVICDEGMNNTYKGDLDMLNLWEGSNKRLLLGRERTLIGIIWTKTKANGKGIWIRNEK